MHPELGEVDLETASVNLGCPRPDAYEARSRPLLPKDILQTSAYEGIFIDPQITSAPVVEAGSEKSGLGT